MNRTNIIIAVAFHAILLFVVVFFASKEGMLGNKMKTLAVTMMPKEKPPEVVKPKTETPKSDIPQPVVSTPKTETVQPPSTAAPKTEAPPMAAPPAAELPSIQFNDGAKEVLTTTDPNKLYASYIEYSFKSQWKRPENINDENFEAFVELTIDNKGKIVDNKWLSGSGNSTWDNSVKRVFAEVKSISRPPPKGFPPTFKVRFDTANE